MIKFVVWDDNTTDKFTANEISRRPDSESTGSNCRWDVGGRKIERWILKQQSRDDSPIMAAELRSDLG
jgi:hypothetical protein